MSRFLARHELPEDKQRLLVRAKRLEWLTIAYLITAIVFVAFALGSSQAMKAAWIEDLLSLLPPIAFLLATRFRDRAPTERFPWGYHRAVTIAYQCAALALLVMGLYVLLDSVLKLVTAEHPPIGTVVLFGEQLWLGWVMLAALAWTGIPPVLLGRRKLKLAAELHDKVLYADAEMNRADWLTAAGAAAGVIGIGFGLWWADAVAGALIACDIVHDGWRNLRRATHDLMDARPSTYDATEVHPLNHRVREALEALDWVLEARVRLREEGHVFTGEALVVPADGEDLVARLADATRHLRDLDWKLHDVVVSPVADVGADAREAETAATAGRAPGRP